MSYEQLKQYLERPGRSTIDPADRDCKPPEDPAWPTPFDYDETLVLMKRLPHWARVVSAVTAAEMVLPIWEESNWVQTNFTEKEIEAPRQAIELIWRWVNGNKAHAADRTTLRTTLADIWQSSMEAYLNASGAAQTAARSTWAALQAATRALDAIQSGGHLYLVLATSRPVLEAAVAASGDIDEDAWVRFYIEWWKLSRCRLAFILEARI